jgi:hypothetical protein
MSWQQLSRQTQAWLAEWMAVTGNDRSEMHGKLTDNIRLELIGLRSVKSPVTLYRGTARSGRSVNPNPNFSTVFSASKSLEMAMNFAGPDGHVYEMVVQPEDVLIDTTMFPPKDIDQAGGFPDEMEVILLPGTYMMHQA